jgi:dinuclear metal center YbgI/SA1388 family protein
MKRAGSDPVTPRTNLKAVTEILEQLAPLKLAESWDNVGLLIGDRCQPVSKIITCLTLTQTTLDEAVDRRADLVVVHHPIPFKPLSRITSDTTTGGLLLKAIRNNIAIYSMHTAWDNAKQGINRQWADALEIRNPQPIIPSSVPELKSLNVGSGVMGTLDPPKTIEEIRERIVAFLGMESIRSTHPLQQRISKLGIVCGSGGSMIGSAADCGCDGFLTGEATYHQCLESEARGIAMIMTGHHASEFFGMKSLAKMLADLLPDTECFASARETSPF